MTDPKLKFEFPKVKIKKQAKKQVLAPVQS